MSEFLIVFVTCDGRDQAHSIAEKVVSEGLAACVNIVPGVRSCYMWEGKQTWSEELLLVMKTTRVGFDRLEKRVRELHSYELPEVLGVPVETGFGKYLDWVKSSVRE